MSNTLKMPMVLTSPTSDDTQPDAKVVTPAPTVEESTLAAALSAEPPAGSAEVRDFIAMLRRERHARARVRRLKRTGWVLGATAVIGFVVVRSGGSSSSAPVPSEAALPAAPMAVEPALPLATEEPWPAPGVPVEASGSSGSAEPSEPSLSPGSPGSPGSSTRHLEGSVPLAAGSERVEMAARCDEQFAQQRWRAAVDSCTGVFEQAPGAALALRIAHAHWSRGDGGQAGVWARKSLGLGTRDADAFVLIGHAERQAGRTTRAAAAYRRYLQWSPHGWHARRLRAALRELRPKASYRQPSARIL